jgi:hypothetical protein
MQTKTQPVTKTRPAPQMQVRSDVRSGGDLETCQFNLNKWRERYYYWYNVAKTAGKI